MEFIKAYYVVRNSDSTVVDGPFFSANVETMIESKSIPSGYTYMTRHQVSKDKRYLYTASGEKAIEESINNSNY